MRRFSLPFLAPLFLALALPAQAQVSPQRLENAGAEQNNWLLYGRTYDNQRFSPLTQINQDNVKNLEQKWVLQTQVAGAWETTPLVVDGIMYVTLRPNDVAAVDAKTGKVFWLYSYKPEPNRSCCGSNNRGVALLGSTLFMGTLDAHLVAIDAKNGKLLWNTTVADVKTSYSITMAPLVVKDKVMVGVAGGESGIRGFLAAYDVKTGKEVWKTYTIPAPGEPGSETWEGDSWKTGGAPIWNSGAYDPALNLVYFGTGNPGPDYNPAQRKGDNLYSDSVMAMDADTGKLKWHFQFTPNDGYDYDSTQVPILVDMDWKGKPAKLMLWANRNGFFYVLDRTNGKFLFGDKYAKATWASGLDKNGRPIQTPPKPGEPVWPGAHGVTNWWSAAFSPNTGYLYVTVWDNYAFSVRPEFSKYEPGKGFNGGAGIPYGPLPNMPQPGNSRPGMINNWTNEVGNGATVALDPRTGKRVWTFTQYDYTDATPLPTASDLLFHGGREGYFIAHDAKTGKILWKANLGGPIYGSITYMVDGKQYISVVAGNILSTFALRD